MREPKRPKNKGGVGGGRRRKKKKKKKGGGGGGKKGEREGGGWGVGCYWFFIQLHGCSTKRFKKT